MRYILKLAKLNHTKLSKKTKMIFTKLLKLFSSFDIIYVKQNITFSFANKIFFFLFLNSKCRLSMYTKKNTQCLSI